MKNPIWENIFCKRQSERDENIHLLSLNPIFSDFSKRDLQKFERIIHLRLYEEDEVIFREGEPGVGMYMVKEGNVKILIKDPITKEEQAIATFKENEAFGDVALFSEDAIRTATVKAVKKSVLLGLCRPDLLGFIHRDPVLGAKLLNNLLAIAGKRLNETNQLLSISNNRIKELEKKSCGE